MLDGLELDFALWHVFDFGIAPAEVVDLTSSNRPDALVMLRGLWTLHVVEFGL